MPAIVKDFTCASMANVVLDKKLCLVDAIRNQLLTWPMPNRLNFINGLGFPLQRSKSHEPWLNDHLTYVDRILRIYPSPTIPGLEPRDPRHSDDLVAGTTVRDPAEVRIVDIRPVRCRADLGVLGNYPGFIKGWEAASREAPGGHSGTLAVFTDLPAPWTVLGQKMIDYIQGSPFGENWSWMLKSEVLTALSPRQAAFAYPSSDVNLTRVLNAARLGFATRFGVPVESLRGLRDPFRPAVHAQILQRAIALRKAGKLHEVLPQNLASLFDSILVDAAGLDLSDPTKIHLTIPSLQVSICTRAIPTLDENFQPIGTTNVGDVGLLPLKMKPFVPGHPFWETLFPNNRYSPWSASIREIPGVDPIYFNAPEGVQPYLPIAITGRSCGAWTYKPTRMMLSKALSDFPICAIN